MKQVSVTAVLPSLLHLGLLDWIGSELSRDYTILRTRVLYPPMLCAAEHETECIPCALRL